MPGYHTPYGSLMHFEDEAIERVMRVVPDILHSKKQRIEEQKKEDKKMFRLGYHREWMGSMCRWVKGTI